MHVSSMTIERTRQTPVRSLTGARFDRSSAFRTTLIGFSVMFLVVGLLVNPAFGAGGGPKSWPPGGHPARGFVSFLGQTCRRRSTRDPEALPSVSRRGTTPLRRVCL